MSRPTVVAGGGVAALEAVLAMRAQAGDSVDIVMLCPDSTFEYRPLSVLQPFGGEGLEIDLDEFARETGIRRVRDRLASVQVDQRCLRTESGTELEYEDLLIAIGCRGEVALPGAVPFNGAADSERLQGILAQIELREASSVAFVALPDQEWLVPLYELALLSRHWLTTHGRRDAQVRVVTAEQDPLEALGEDAIEAVQLLLGRAGIRVHGGVVATRVEDRLLRVKQPGFRFRAKLESIPADHVITLARMRGSQIPGLPQDADGLVPIDMFGGVSGADHLYAAGDITAGYPKQGGLGARQAIAATSAILADRGLIDEAVPFDPELTGVLLTPLVLERAAAGNAWRPPSKIVAPYLAAHLGTRAPDSLDPGNWSTSAGALPTEIHVAANLD